MNGVEKTDVGRGGGMVKNRGRRENRLCRMAGCYADAVLCLRPKWDLRGCLCLPSARDLDDPLTSTCSSRLSTHFFFIRDLDDPLTSTCSSRLSTHFFFIRDAESVFYLLEKSYATSVGLYNMDLSGIIKSFEVIELTISLALNTLKT
jgi:hypothetical protein